MALGVVGSSVAVAFVARDVAILVALVVLVALVFVLTATRLLVPLFVGAAGTTNSLLILPFISGETGATFLAIGELPILLVRGDAVPTFL